MRQSMASLKEGLPAVEHGQRTSTRRREGEAGFVMALSLAALARIGAQGAVEPLAGPPPTGGGLSIKRRREASAGLKGYLQPLPIPPLLTCG